MIINQRDVFEIHFTFSGSKVEVHPVVVLSIPSVINYEGTFIGVPISHSAICNKNRFSFPIFDESFEKPLKYHDSHIRMHLIATIHIHDMVNKYRLNTMKQEDFNELVWQMQDLIFGLS